MVVVSFVTQVTMAHTLCLDNFFFFFKDASKDATIEQKNNLIVGNDIPHDFKFLNLNFESIQSVNTLKTLQLHSL